MRRIVARGTRRRCRPAPSRATRSATTTARVSSVATTTTVAARRRARAAPFLLLGLRGTPFLYYGEELGMADVDIPEELLQDPARIHREGRDPERTPMQWDAIARPQVHDRRAVAAVWPG